MKTKTPREFRVIAVKRNNETLAEFHYTEVLKARAFAKDMGASVVHVFNVSPQRACAGEPRTPRYRDTFSIVDSFLWQQSVDDLIRAVDSVLTETKQ